MTSLVFENDYVLCELDDTLPVLKHRWKKETPGESFRKNLIAIQQHYIELVKEYPHLAWLADTQLLGEVDRETEEWFSTTWDDLIFNKANVKIHAVILGDDLFAEDLMETFKINAEQKFSTHNIQLGVFSDEEEAYDWIRTR